MGKREQQNTRRLKIMIKAKTLRDVFLETHKVDIKEAYRRYRPNNSPKCADTNSYRDFDSHVLEEFAKMIRVDDKAIKQLKNNRVLKEILEDLNRINAFLESGACTIEETVKLTAAKDSKLKMLGSFKGMWKGEQENKGQGENSQELYDKLRERYDSRN